MKYSRERIRAIVDDLRTVVAAEPTLPWHLVAARVGVASSYARKLARQHGIGKAAAPRNEGMRCHHKEPAPSGRRRCTRCGGIIDDGGPVHLCRTAEAHDRGLLFERQMLEAVR